MSERTGSDGTGSEGTMSEVIISEQTGSDVMVRGLRGRGR